MGFEMAGQRKMVRGEYEVGETQLVRRLLGRVVAFVDIGANVGYYTLIARQLGHPVLAVEPGTANLRYLLANLAHNGFDEVEVVAAGLAERRGFTQLWGVGDGASTDRNWKGRASPHSERVPLTTLDHLLVGRFEQASLLIKIDIEGAEYGALMGARETLRRSQAPVWLVEIYLDRRRAGLRNPDFLRTFELFWENGYRAAEGLIGGAEVTRAAIESWVIGSGRPTTANYLFWKSDLGISDIVNPRSPA